MHDYPHRIRLRGPWECHTSAGQITVTVPSRLRDLGLDAGQVRLVRKFGYPGHLDSFERVWLTFADIQGIAQIAVNGQPIGRDCSGACEFEATARLGKRNRLEVDLAAASDACGLTGEVALEVRCAVYLRDVSVRRSAANELTVTGQIVGSWPEPFDLYMLLDGVNVYYQSVQTGVEPVSFTAVIPSAGGRTLRVDLVQGPSSWFRTDLAVPTPA